MANDLIESYRILVDVLLDHATLHEKTDAAVADFLSSDDAASEVLSRIIEAQSVGEGVRN